MAFFCGISGHFAEFRRWLEQAVHHAGDSESPELARCLSYLALVSRDLGDLDSAHEHAKASVDMWRQLDDDSRLGLALSTLAVIENDRGHPDVARALYEEALDVARSGKDNVQLEECLAGFASLETAEGNFERSEALIDEAIAIAREHGDSTSVRAYEHDHACTMWRMGRVEDAQRHMRDSIPGFLRDNEPRMLVVLAEDYAAVLAELGQHQRAVRLLGAAEAMRQRLGTPRPATQQADLVEPIAKTHAALTDQEWQAAYRSGSDTTVEDALTEAHAATLPG